MVVVKAKMGHGPVRSRESMSLILDNGDIHHFFALHDGVHHSWTRRYRGRYDDALQSELRRPNAAVVSHELGSLRLVDGSEDRDSAEALAS